MTKIESCTLHTAW